MSTASIDRLDGVSSSVAIKAPCSFTTTANIVLSGLGTQAGGTWPSTLTQDDNSPTRILVKSQTNPIDNGIWNPGAGTWTRAKDFDGARDVVQGTVCHTYQFDGDLWFEVSTANPIVIGTSAINFVASTATSILARLDDPTSASNGDAMVAFKALAIGAVGETLHTHLGRLWVTPQSFGAVGNGTNNDTAALQLFLNACVAGYPGYWGPGTWMADEGVLTIQPPSNIDYQGPMILTAGYKATVLKGRGTTEAPLLTVQNLTQVSGAGKFLMCGTLGGIGFDGSDQPGGWTTAHALSLRGINSWHFGQMLGTQLRGDLINLPQELFGGNNPDPYHVAFCVFEGLQSNFGNGWVLNNDNFVGFTCNHVLSISCYGSSTGFGALRGCGAGNEYKIITVGTCYGRAVDIYDGSAGGRCTREIIHVLELDNPEYGIRLVNGDQVEIKFCRIVHRYNAGSGFWPRVALELSNGAGTAAVSNCKFDIVHRIDPVPAGGVKADLGQFLELNNSSAITGVSIKYKINDNAGFGITNTDVLNGADINSSATVTIETSLPVDETVVYDSRYVVGFMASATVGATITTGNFGAVAGNIGMSVEAYDKRGDYSGSTYTVPVTGVYAIDATIHITGAAVGDRVRLGIFDGTNILKTSTSYAAVVGRQSYSLVGLVALTRGQTITLNGDTNHGSDLNLDLAIGTNVDNSWSLTLVAPSVPQS